MSDGKVFMVAEIDEAGSIQSIETRDTYSPGPGWPATVLLHVVLASPRAGALKCVEWLRITRPTWVRYLKSRPGAHVMKNTGGGVQAPKRTT